MTFKKCAARIILGLSISFWAAPSVKADGFTYGLFKSWVIDVDQTLLLTAGIEALQCEVVDADPKKYARFDGLGECLFTVILQNFGNPDAAGFVRAWLRFPNPESTPRDKKNQRPPIIPTEIHWNFNADLPLLSPSQWERILRNQKLVFDFEKPIEGPRFFQSAMLARLILGSDRAELKHVEFQTWDRQIDPDQTHTKVRSPWTLEARLRVGGIENKTFRNLKIRTTWRHSLPSGSKSIWEFIE